jgi:hypothetical protein
MKKLRLNKWLVIQSFFFAFLSLSFILPNGFMHCTTGICNLQIGQWHLHDSLWHISLAKLGFGSWPLQNPLMAGESLSSYNFLLDYILHLLSRLGISPFFSFFQLLPIIAALLYIWSVLRFIKTRTSNLLKANLLAFFLYFGSSFSYLATLYQDRTFFYSSLRGFPVVTSIQPATMFLNLQFAFSLSVILWIIMLINRKDQKRQSIILGILFFVLFGLKFYGGVVALLFTSIFKLLEFVGKRLALRDFLTQALLIITGSFLGLLVFYGVSSGSSIPFSWAPLALTHLLIDDSLLFYNHSLTLARYHLYENATSFSPRLWAIEAYSLGLFLLINFGTRILAGIYVASSIFKKKLSPFYQAISFTILLTVLAPILFVQNGGWYNTMQFLYYGAWLSGILLVEWLSDLAHSKWRGSWLIIFLIIIFTIPNNLEQLRFLTADQEIIGNEELEALSVLKEAPPGIVYVNNPVHRNAVIPALAEKYTYYLDTDQLMVLNSSYQPRLDVVNKYKGGSITSVPADYYYIYKTEWGTEDAVRALSSPVQFELIYDSTTISLYMRKQ